MLKKSKDGKVFAIKGEVRWCDPRRINKLANKYTTDIVNIDDATVAELRKIKGVNLNYDAKTDPNDPEFKGHWIKLKSDNPIVPTDANGDPLPERMLIGHGSIAWLTFKQQNWVFEEGGKAGVKVVWLGMRVVDLVRYDPNAAIKEQSENLLDEIVDGNGYQFGDGEAPVSGGTDDQFEDMFGEAS